MTSSENSENVCIVCFKNVLIYAIGECKCQKVNICYECSTRMRVLCHQNECPICRQDLPKVIFTSAVAPFRSINTSSYLMDKKYKICFEGQEIQSAYNKLLEHACNLCSSRPAFRTFQNLKDHMRKEHDLQYCDLCVDNLKIFTGERRSYTRQELAQHRRKGDTDDRSHRGHPLCEFCDQRYMDNDELYRHLRRDHLFCHFCDADGFHHYYPSYDDLRHHFRTEHYLCEEGGCEEVAGEYSVFRTEIDLKAHRASVHGRALGKAATKQARTLELEFTLAPRPKERGADARRGGGARFQPTQAPEEEAARLLEEDYHQAEPTTVPINTNCIDEFPTLRGGGVAATTGASRRPMANGVTIRHHGGNPPAVTDANFPALGPDGVGACKTVRLNFNSSGRDRPGGSGKPPTNVSIHVNRSAGGVRIQPLPRDDFPSLSKNRPAPAAAQWTAQTKPKQPPAKPAQTYTVQQAFPGLKTAVEYPSLNARFNSACTVTPRTDKVAPMPEVARPREEKVGKATMQDVARAREEKAGKTTMSDVARAREEKAGKVSMSDVVKTKEVAAEGNKAKVKKKKPKGAVKEAVAEGGNKKKRKEIVEPEAPQPRRKNVDVAEGAAEEAARPVNGVAERKRSELNIASLAEPSPAMPPLAVPPPDVPSLAGCSGWPTPAEVPPPPGFTTKAPPPGFSVTLNSVARPPPPNGLTFTSSSGQSYSILPTAPTRIFTQPQDFNQRNSALIAKVVASLRDNDISEFRQLSTLFRQGTLSAQSFVSHCRDSMGAAFSDIVREMLVLLPDIGKQQELYSVFSRSDRAGLEVCATCSQVLAASDLRHHLLSHTLENHFPALGGAEAAGDHLPAAQWGRK